MSSSYLNKYTIVQIFKSNDFQKVYIATDNSNAQAVVINNIFTSNNTSLWDLVEEKYQHIFNHLLHFERRENEIILVTKVEEGLSLSAYLNAFSPSFAERVRLIRQYLDGISKYDLLPNDVKSVLVDESQIILNNGVISFDELIIFNESSFGTNSFDPIMNNIISVLKKLTKLENINYDELPLFIKTMGFLDELQRNKSLYYDISQVFDSFNHLDIADLSIIKEDENLISTKQNILNVQKDVDYSDATNLVGRKVGSLNEDMIKMADGNKKRNLTVAISAAGAVTVALAGILIFKSVLPLGDDISLNANTSPNETVFSQNLDLNSTNENSSNKNSTDEKSDDSSDPIASEVRSPNKNITYVSEYVFHDYGTTKYGDFSFMISGDNGPSHKLSINQGPINEGAQFLMWLKSDSNDPFKIKVIGYSGDKTSFKKEISYKPLFVNGWELVQLSFDSNISDNIDVVFDDVTGTVWIDKISIDLFK